MNNQDFITTIYILSLSIPTGLVLKSVNWIKVKRWFVRTWTKERIIDFFCNWAELAADDLETY